MGCGTLRDMDTEQARQLIVSERERLEGLVREKDFSLLEQLEAEIGDLDAALRKVEEGTYGICEVCGRSIEPDRLEALPGTRTCIEHAGAS